MRWFIYAIFLCLAFLSCTPVFQARYLSFEKHNLPAEIADTLLLTSLNTCNETDHYIPDSNYLKQFPFQRIRVNFHFMNSSDSTNNIYGEEAREYARNLIYYANRKLDDNRQMLLPEGNNTGVLPIPFRYHLQPDGSVEGDDGIYFHYDDEHYYFLNKGKHRNNYSRKLIEKYAVNPDTVLNIFYMNHHPDSIASKTYTASGSGIALGSSIKLGVVHEKDTKPWKYASLINHEIGHVYGLRHSWTGSDGCEDTPKHPNCWTGHSKAPCDGERSNNVMDYNPDQNAYTPCQIGRIEKQMMDENGFQRDLLKPIWCDRDTNYNYIVMQKEHWTGAKDLYGDLIIKSGALLQIDCRVSMPANSKIIVEPGATLILNNAKIHNSCGYLWNGIEEQRFGKQKATVYYYGRVTVQDCDHPFEIGITD
jgi:hypothetical protein